MRYALAMLLAACGSSGGSPDGPVTTADAPIVVTPDAPPATSCGNGKLEPGEGCEFDTDCTRRQSCSAQCACVALDPPPPDTSQVLIDDDYRAGTISLGTALLYRAYAIYHDPRLPEAYDGVGVDPEDGTLALDVARAMPMLSQAELDALMPYLVRPTDPRSIFSTGFGGAQAAKTGLKPADDCPMIVGCKDWQAVTSAHFRVWTCGTSTIAEATLVKDDAESLYDPEVTLMGPPEDDNVDNVDGFPATTDIYLVDLTQGRTRNGECVMINDSVELGKAIVDLNGFAVASVGGTASAFILLEHDLDYRKSVTAHEFFHVLEAAHSTQALESWLAEASAKWAESHFVRETSGQAVMPFFNNGNENFLARVGVRIDRDGSETSVPNAYEAFIWPYFAEQETGADTIGRIWNATGSARDLQAANSVFPFKTHFKDFIVRNLNDDSLDSAGLPKYDNLDPMFPAKTSIPMGKGRENLGSLKVGMPTIGLLNLDRLAAHYADVGIDGDNIREITFDFSKVNGDGLDVELMLATNLEETTWKHVSMADMKKYTLCTETDPPKVYAARIAIGNHSIESNFVTGMYQVTGKASCCPAGQTCWTGDASVATNIVTPYGTIHGSIQASVKWKPLAQDPTGTVFVPTGSATYSASGQAGDCAITLQATTLAIDENDGLLQFNPSTNPVTYMVSGSTAGPAGVESIMYHFDCPPPSGSFDLPGDVKPWLLENGFLPVSADGNTVAGTYNAADGNSYSWTFTR